LTVSRGTPRPHLPPYDMVNAHPVMRLAKVLFPVTY